MRQTLCADTRFITGVAYALCWYVLDMQHARKKYSDRLDLVVPVPMKANPHGEISADEPAATNTVVRRGQQRERQCTSYPGYASGERYPI